MGYICNNSKISGRVVGKIDVKGVYSFFEVPHAEVDKVMNAFKGIDFKGREVRIEISGEGTSHSRGNGGGGDRRDSGYRSGGRRDDGNRGGEHREGGFRERNPAANAGFRDFSGKRREDRPERRKRY